MFSIKYSGYIQGHYHIRNISFYMCIVQHHHCKSMCYLPTYYVTYDGIYDDIEDSARENLRVLCLKKKNTNPAHARAKKIK